MVGNIKVTHSVSYASKQDNRVEVWKIFNNKTLLFRFHSKVCRYDAFGFICRLGMAAWEKFLIVTSTAVALIHDYERVKESS